MIENEFVVFLWAISRLESWFLALKMPCQEQRGAQRQ
jgi:hypothetical protein